MRTWAQWLVNNNLRYVLYIIWLICFPIYMIARLRLFICAFFEDALYDLKNIKDQEKTK